MLLAAAWYAAAQVTPVWSTGVAVPEEQVLLYLVDTEVGEDIFSIREQPRVQSAGVQILQSKAGANPLDANRAMVQILPILVRPDKAGTLQIPDLTVSRRSKFRRSKCARPHKLNGTIPRCLTERSGTRTRRIPTYTNPLRPLSSSLSRRIAL